MKGNSSRRPADLPLLGAALCSELSRHCGAGGELMICVMMLCLKLEDGGVCLNLSDEEARRDAADMLLSRLDGASGPGCSEFLKVLGIEPGASEDPLEAVEDKFGKGLPFLTGSGFDAAAIAGAAAGVPDGDSPLVWDLGRLYFRRYFDYERSIAEYVGSRPECALEGDRRARARAILDALFPESGIDWTDGSGDQKCAAALSLLSPFTVISGGPGTGKTTTVSKILMAKIALSGKENPRVLLAAPTGKAAARLSESISGAFGGGQREKFERFERDFAGGRDLMRLIPQRASTVHSLIGVRPHSDTCRNNAGNKLACDILVVDEVSMVDMPLFAKLCAALPDSCDLVLLGDRCQLCSVEAGAVLADLCSGGSGEAGAKEVANLLGAGVRDVEGAFPAPHVALLRKSYRFKGDSGIGSLAQTVNDRAIADPKSMKQALSKCLPSGDGECAIAGGADEQKALVEEALGDDGYGEFFTLVSGWKDRQISNDEAKQALESMDKFRVLCSNRRGPMGTEEVNRRIVRAARKRFRLPAGDWFPGRIVIVTRNNPSAGVSNGDVGFCARGRGGGIRVWFPGGADGVRSVNPVFLTDSEDGFALTVHKSQGSEYDNIALCLSASSDGENLVLTRELAYTGITRARRKITVYSGLDLLASCCVKSTRRDSALQERIRAAASK
jgi:exodeoxyribonuclease V alpha subunit